MNQAFFDAVRWTLGKGQLTQKQVDWLNAIVSAWTKYGDGDERKLSYILGTAWHESGRFRWLEELWGPTAAQKRYEGRKDLGNTRQGDGYKFRGRGPVMITGRRNYTDWSRRLGVDLLKAPDLASTPEIGARVLVQGSMLGTFTGKSLGDYIGGGRADYIEARRVINGTDRASLIAGYAEKFEQAIDQADFATAKPTQPSKPSSAPSAPDGTEKAPSGSLWLFLILIAAIVVAFFIFT